jgi:hypothetical protein
MPSVQSVRPTRERPVKVGFAHRQRQAAQVLAIERHDVRLAHHVTVNGGKRRLMVAALRYLDTFVKMDGTWFFAERGLYVDWLEERPLS